MTDVTNYDYFQLRTLLIKLMTDTTNPIYSPDNPNKVIGERIYKTGIGFDTESTTITHTVTEKNKTKTVVDYCFLYSYQISIGTQHYSLYRTYEEFNNFIHVLHGVLKNKSDFDKSIERPSAKCIIWVANLSHEWSFIKYKITRDFEIEKCFAKSPRDVLYVDFGLFVLRECIGLFGHSLADIAKNWTQTQKLKGDLNYDLIRTPSTILTEKEKQYCINDVIILSEMHDAVLKAYTQDNGGVILPNTSSGFVRLKLKSAIRESEELTAERISHNEYRKKEAKTNLAHLMKLNAKLYFSQFQWEICRNYGYCGGLCGSNIEDVGKTLHNIQCVDLTSDYPAQMIQRKFPYGTLRRAKLSEYDDIRNKHKPYFMICIFKKLESKTEHATFSKHKALNFTNPIFQKKYGTIQNLIAYNGKIRRGNNIVACINDIDLSAYNEIYDMEYTPLALYVFSGYKKIPQWMFDCITHDYVTKSKLKIAKMQNTVEYMDSKRNVNTYYGVLSTKPSDMYDEFMNGLFAPSDETTFENIKYQSWLNPYIAFWVTSYARKILMHFISMFPDLIVQYDTDSLYYKTDKPNSEQLKKAIERYNAMITAKNEKIFEHHPDKKLFLSLGTWDFETIYCNFLPLGAKKYIKQDTENGIQTVIAGLPKTAIPAEIANRNIKKPFTHYNVLKKYIDTNYTINTVVVKHQFANKFASVYCDDDYEIPTVITDYMGNTETVLQGCYHAIIPIDFTLALGIDYAQQIVRLRLNETE